MLIGTFLETNKGVYYSKEHNTIDTNVGTVSANYDSLNYAQMMKLIGLISIYDIHLDHTQNVKLYHYENRSTRN